MQKNYRKWAIGIVAFFLCFSFIVNVHCVLLLLRYRQIYQAPPVWATEAGAYVTSSQEEQSRQEPPDEAKSTQTITTEDEPVKMDIDAKKQEKTDVAEDTDKTGTTVYLTKSGTKFHRDGCSSLSKSKISISYEDAVTRGFEPCGRCNP